MTDDLDDHVSIGDVLDQLRDEFPDVTVSKIRFLESQGLIDPERTPSGYRKFYDADVERLRWVLRQQREHFLPLKVIRERLDEIDRAGGLGRSRGVPGTEALARIDDDPTARPTSIESGGASITRPELAAAVGLTPEAVHELEEYGLIRPAFTSGERVLFDEEAVGIAKVAAEFLALGVEARHLRMYRAMADREAGLFDQILLPFRHRRNPEATAEGERRAAELAELGWRMRDALLAASLRQGH